MKSIYFKRLALVVVAALGMGLLSTGPTSAAVTDETFTVSLQLPLLLSAIQPLSQRRLLLHQDLRLLPKIHAPSPLR